MADAMLQSQADRWTGEADHQRYQNHWGSSWSSWGRWGKEKERQWSSPWAKEPRSLHHNGDSGAHQSSQEQWAKDDSDDDWGSWTAPKEPRTVEVVEVQPKEPEAKRPRLANGNSEAGSSQVQSAPKASVWKRMESTRQAGIFYYLNTITNETQVEPPPPWQKLQSRRNPDTSYYWNPETSEALLEKPDM
ncbi:unnamed protein product [Symbiodinium pilosum]|uniref:WW domain-containing protein n=1 Tax=Symbiodinium pilosum TaxID=2952 RepID=A0A812JTT6_SYMPI|nr:unnamed protein product [Symbiodinium pilosum]